MSMRYTGKNWKEVRKVWRNNPKITTLDSIIKAKKQTEDKAHKAFMRAARDSGAIGNGLMAEGNNAEIFKRLCEDSIKRSLEKEGYTHDTNIKFYRGDK
jgi:hypothetical protein